MVDAVGDGRVDRVLGDIAAGTEVVRARVVLAQVTVAGLHDVRRLPGPHDHLADAAHGLGVGGHHRDGAHVVQQVLGGHGGGPDPGVGELHVRLDLRVEVVAHDHHVDVLLDGVDREGPGGIRRRGQHVRLAREADHVGGVAAAGALDVEDVQAPVLGVLRPAVLLGRGEGVVHEAGLVQGVGVQGDLDPGLLAHVQRRVDHGRRRAPVLVDLEAQGPGRDLVVQRLLGDGAALGEQADVDREGVQRLEHALDVPLAGVTVVAVLPSAGPVPPPISVVTPEATASWICSGHRKCTWVSTPPAVRMRPLPEITSVSGPTTKADARGSRRPAASWSRGCTPCRWPGCGRRAARRRP